jgi:hypothetical protein
MLKLHTPRVGYKLFRKRKDGSLGSLFLNRSKVISTGEWLRAEEVTSKKLSFRPGWHICQQPIAPHLKTDGRVWYKVMYDDYYELKRPEYQGGVWIIAKWIKLIGEADM